MDLYKALVANAKPIAIEPSETSYFSTPQTGLDPRLFRNKELAGNVRDGIMGVLFSHLESKYSNPQAYTQVWLAGSGVSYIWAANRHPADLDCLVGIDYVGFRRANTQFERFSDQDIASMLNEGFREELHPLTDNYLNSFELTFYVNTRTDIRDIKPYAAYSLTENNWTVEPTDTQPKVSEVWDKKIQRDVSFSVEILDRYTDALSKIGNATTPAARLNAEAALKLAVEQGAALFETIHHGRGAAFSPSGHGYMDYDNYRWQAGKKSGVVQALKQLKDISSKTRQQFEAETYGMTLPDASVLVRRASLHKS
jgi:hypothetical protein